MNELLIAIAVVPVVFFVFGGISKLARVVLWLPATVAILCVANSLYFHFDDPMWWAPVASFLALAASEVIQNKKISSLSVLCLSFVAQALLTSDIVNIIICLALADMFLNVEIFTSTKLEQKNSSIHNIYKSLFSFFPVLLGVLLQMRGDPFTAMVLLTIVLRLFSWPINQWHSAGSRFSGLLIGAGSTFALWHVLNFSAQSEWGIVLLSLAAILSLGASYAEIYLALSLGAFCISPTFGILATAAWPLLLHRGRASYLLLLLASALGLIICDFSTKVLVDNALYGVACLGGVMLARPFVAMKMENRPWLKEMADVLLSLGLLGLFVYLIPLPPLIPGSIGITFVCVFLLSYFIGLFLVQKKPKLFVSLGPLKLPLLPDPVEPLGALKEAAGDAIRFKERKYLEKLFSVMESESHLAWLLGALGLALIWGLK